MAHDNRERRKRLERCCATWWPRPRYFAAGQRLKSSPRPRRRPSTRRSSTSSTTHSQDGLHHQVQRRPAGGNCKPSCGPTTSRGRPWRASTSGPSKRCGNTSISPARRTIRLCCTPLVERFAGRPWGWPDDETLILVARLLVHGRDPADPRRRADPARRRLRPDHRHAETAADHRHPPQSPRPREARGLPQARPGTLWRDGPERRRSPARLLEGPVRRHEGEPGHPPGRGRGQSYPGLAEITDAQALVTAILAPRDSVGLLRAAPRKQGRPRRPGLRLRRPQPLLFPPAAAVGSPRQGLSSGSPPTVRSWSKTPPSPPPSGGCGRSSTPRIPTRS